MDPSAITSPLWDDIGKLLISLWAVVLLIVLFATNMLIGHNFLPSLLATRDVPQSFQKTRPAFYALALICFGGAMYFLSRVVDFAGVLRGFWADYWI